MIKRTLENRIARLEKLLKSVKNEVADDPVATAVYNAAENIKQIVNDLCKTIAYDDITDYGKVNMALKVCENSFSADANDRFDSIFNSRKNGKVYKR